MTKRALTSVGSQQRRRALLLRHPQFRLLLAARSVSFFGDSLAPVAIPFAVLSIGGNVTEVGVVLGAATVTNLLFLRAGGVIADRLPRRLLLVASDVTQGTVMTLMCALLLSHRAEVWQLVALQGLFGVAMALNLPAFNGVVPQVVEGGQMQSANGLLSVAQSAAQVVGPGIAGALIAVGSPGLAIGVDAVTFFVSALLLLRLRVSAERSEEPQSHFLRDLVEGWREMVERRWYWMCLLAHAGCNFVIGLYSVMGPVVVGKYLGGASSWGVVSVAGSVGGLLGGLTFMRLWLRRPLVAGNLTVILYAPNLLFLIRPSPLWAVMAAATTGAFAISILNGAWNTTVQQIVPLKIMSRLSSYDWLISFATLPLGYALAGPLAESLGRQTLLLAAAAGLALPCLLTILDPRVWAVRSYRNGTVIDPESHAAASPSLRSTALRGHLAAELGRAGH
jgi:MFS family permease